MTMHGFQSRYSKLLARRTDPLTKSIRLDQRLLSSASEEAIKYIVGSMMPVDSAYTHKSFEEADRVRNQLEKNLPSHMSVEFDFQGSVTNNTNIRLHSDIDLLMVTKDFYYLHEPLQVTSVWKGDVTAHFSLLRKKTAEIIESEFPAAVVNKGKGKALALSGGSLLRKIDVVHCAWLKTVASISGTDRPGIRVYDNDTGLTVVNFPFLHNKKLEERDNVCSGNLKKLIRFLKSAKEDSDNKIDVSSYDIAGLAYNFPLDLMIFASGHELKMVRDFSAWAKLLLTSPASSVGLMVPNGTRALFHPDGLSNTGLTQLIREIDSILPPSSTTPNFGSRNSNRLIDVLTDWQSR